VSFIPNLTSSPSLAVDGLAGTSASAPVAFPAGFTGVGAIPFAAADAALTMTVAVHGSLVSMTPTATRIITLASTGVATGFPVMIINNSATFSITINASGGTQITVCGPSTSISLYSNTAAPTLNTQWSIANGGAFLLSGNSVGAAITLGTNDNFDLNLRTNGVVGLTLSTAGAVTMGFTPSTNITHRVNGRELRLIGPTGDPAFFQTDQATNNAGKRWRFGHTGGIAGFNSFDLQNETDNIIAFSASSAGAVTMGASAAVGLKHSLIGNNVLVLGDGGTVDFKNRAETTTFMSIQTTTGAVTIGPPVNLNYNGTAHSIAGGLRVATPTSPSTDQAYSFNLTANSLGDNATHTRTNTANGGVRFILNPRTSDNDSCFNIQTTPAGSSLATSPDKTVFAVTAAGSVTLGPSAGLAGFHLIRNTSTTSSTLYLSNSSTSTSSDTHYSLICEKGSTTVSTSQNYILFQANAGASLNGKINGNGANSAAFGSTSDSRVKENVADMEPMLANMVALRPVTFDYIQTASTSAGEGVGFIAQEMEVIFPDAVSEDGNGFKQISGWDKTTARLVKALQELSAKNDALEARLATLEGITL